MDFIKRLFFMPEEVVMQLHVSEARAAMDAKDAKAAMAAHNDRLTASITAEAKRLGVYVEDYT